MHDHYFKGKAYTTEGFTSMLSIHLVRKSHFNQVQWPLEDLTELLAALWLEDNLRRVYHALGLNVSVKKFRGKKWTKRVGESIFFDQNISRIL